MGQVKEMTLKTTGMHCRSCSALVDMTVGDLGGVEKVETDFASGDTNVSFDTEKVSVDDIIAAIKEAGYNASA